ncbi:MAG: hypothetical protein ACRDV9_00020, partial [Acidimicrobiia bacterium]
LALMVYAVTSAAFCLISALSGMRSSELLELTAGSGRSEERPAGASRYRLVSRRIKGEAFGGVEDAWVVIEEVHRALGVAKTVTGARPGELLFTRQSNTANVRYVRFRRWVNGPAGQRLGLMEIPDGPVNPRALRRTLALSIAQRPHGLMAAKVHLKHVSVATTEGYAARPGGHQAAFLAEVATEEEAEHVRLTMAAYDEYRRGVLPSGKGARELLSCFAAVDHALANHEAGAVTVIDDRRVERLLHAKAKTAPRRNRELLLVLRPAQGPVFEAGRHAGGDRAADRDVRLGPLPPGHPSRPAPSALGRSRRSHEGRARRQPSAHEA